MEHIKTQSEGQYLPEPGHERTDINIPLVLGFGGFLAVSGVVLFLVMWGFYNLLNWRYEASQEKQAPVMEQQAKAQGQTASQMAEDQQQTLKRIVATFPEPRLQADEYTDQARKKQTDMSVLTHYSWLNQSAGAVRIPVDRAMELIAQRGLPNIGAGPAPAAPGQTLPPAGQGKAVKPPVKPTSPLEKK
jgi:hypothetical protein